MTKELTEQTNNNSSAISVEQSRATQEVQGAILMAKKFPRDENAAYNRIVQACNRPKLAESAMYTYPRGGQQVTGPSIRLAETLVKYWGNIQFGIVELSQENGSSEVMAYAWDLESNTRQVKQFTVKHSRYSKAKGNTKLIDPRDIYEMTANQGARRLRACILGVLPSDIIEEAISQCEKTLRGDGKEPLADRVRKCVASFAEIGVTSEMIEDKMGHNIDSINPYELVNLGKIFNSIRDNMGSIADYFSQPNHYEKQKKKIEEAKDKKKAQETTEKPSVVNATQKITPNEEQQDTFFNLVKNNLEDETINLKDKENFWADKKKQIDELPEDKQIILEKLLNYRQVASSYNLNQDLKKSLSKELGGE